MSQTNTNGTPNMKEFISMENFFLSGKIEDYTEDGWVLVESEWIPFSYFIKKKKENNPNEHS